MKSKKVLEWIKLKEEGKEKEAEALKKEIFEKETKERFKKMDLGKWDLEILTVGHSAEPIILSILALKPQRCVFICTKESRRTLDRVYKECGIEPSMATIEEITSRANAEDVYEIIARNYRNDIRVCVDITGGTKAMVGGAALGAGVLRIPVFYIKYEDVPDSEEIVELKNPLDIFKPVEDTIGIKLFDAHAYSASVETFGLAHGTTSNPEKMKEFEIKKDIACGYMKWDRFDYRGAREHFENAARSIRRFEICKKCEEVIENQNRVLEKLEIVEGNRGLAEVLKDEEIAYSLIVDMFLNAERRAKQEHFVDGIVRLYRTLEFITQFELVKNGIAPENVGEDVREKYGKKFNEVSSKVYNAGKELPKKLSLMDSAILLYCLHTEGQYRSVLWEPLAGIDDVERFQRALWPRNESIVVHGIRASGEREYENLKNLVFNYMKKLISEKKMEELLELHRHRTASELFD